MMSERNGPRVGGRILLALLTFYALAMIAPDFLRVFRPLGSFGMETNADGRIYDVEAQSPAGRAGLSDKDSLDLERMSCIPVDTEVCASNLALWGGRTYVTPGLHVTLLVKASGDGPVREVTLIAEKVPLALSLRSVLLLDWIAGILVVLGAAFLVWILPGPMTWGFFAYAMYYNPAQWFQFYAWLQQWPRALLVQDVVACILQAAGFVGLLLFALRAPVDRVERRWRGVERALPALALPLLAIALIESRQPVRSSDRIRHAVVNSDRVRRQRRGALDSPRPPRRSVAARLSAHPLGYLGLPYRPACLSRRRDLDGDFPAYKPPRGGTRGRGLPPLFCQRESYACSSSRQCAGGPWSAFGFRSVGRPSSGSCSPCRSSSFTRNSTPSTNSIRLPKPYWVLGAAVLIFLIYRVHDWLTEHVDRLFDRNFRLAEERLAEAARAIQRADNLDEIERLLVEEPLNSLRLASAALFRAEDGLFRRRVSAGWGAADAVALKDGEPPLAGNLEGPFRLSAGKIADPPDAKLPGDLARPILGIPVGNPRRRIAVVLYGPHEAGTNLSEAERELLWGLAREAEISCEQVENETLRTRILALEGQHTSSCGGLAKPCLAPNWSASAVGDQPGVQA